MKNISYNLIVNTVKEMCMEANFVLPKEVLTALKKSQKKEKSNIGKSILEQCVKNAKIANKEFVPICQDTGFAVFFIKIGSDVKIKGGLLTDAINKGVKLGYKEGYLRKSILKDPLYNRENTDDNTPAIIHTEIVAGDKLDIIFMPKGGGAENMSKVCMLPPSAGEKGVIDFVVNTVTEAGGNACPPTIVGVGIGGTLEKVALISKKALAYPLGKPNKNKDYNKLEKTILKKINASNVGPQGLGGNVSCLNVHIETFPCHLASLPVAVNINCHVHRHSHITL